MNPPSTRLPLLLAGLLPLLISLACQSLFPKTVQPGSLEEQMADGNMRFNATTNLTYIGCQDPSAAINLTIGTKTKEIDDTQFNNYVNPVSVHAITDGSLVKMGECQKVSQALLAQEGVEIVGINTEPGEALDCIGKYQPDVVIVNLDDPEPEVSQAVLSILRDKQELSIIWLSLKDNIIRIYRGECKQVGQIDDLMKVIKA